MCDVATTIPDSLNTNKTIFLETMEKNAQINENIEKANEFSSWCADTISDYCDI